MVCDMTLMQLVRSDAPTAAVRVGYALELSGGDREGAAEFLGVSLRTLARVMSALRLAPPHVENRNNGTSDALLSYIRGCTGGVIDYGEAALELYGEDTRATRQRVMSKLTRLQQSGRIERVAEGTWRVSSR